MAIQTFDEYWKDIEGDFSSCKGVTKLASKLAWIAAIEASQQLMRDCEERQLICQLEDLKP